MLDKLLILFDIVGITTKVTTENSNALSHVCKNTCFSNYSFIVIIVFVIAPGVVSICHVLFVLAFILTIVVTVVVANMSFICVTMVCVALLGFIMVMYLYMCMCICMYVSVWCMYIYVSMSVCMYIYMIYMIYMIYIYIYIYTYILLLLLVFLCIFAVIVVIITTYHFHFIEHLLSDLNTILIYLNCLYLYEISINEI